VEYTLDWLSDASGDVNSVNTAIKEGIVVQVKYVPDSGGTQPSNLYDVTLEDSDGIDYLGGTGANLSNAVSMLAVPVMDLFSGAYWWIGGNLELKVTNAGNAKGGQVILYMR